MSSSLERGLALPQWVMRSVPSTDGPSGWRARVWPWVLVSVLLVCVAVLLTTGQPLLAVVPAGVALLAAFVWTQPLRYTVFPVVFAQCVFFSPGFDASGALWTNVFDPGYRFVTLYLNKTTPLAFMSISGQELTYVLLFALILTRIVRGQRIDRVGQTKSANVLYFFLALSLVAIVWLEMWGTVRGGNMRSSLFQIRQFLWLPLQTFVLGCAMRDSGDFRRIGIIITLAAIIKAAAGTYLLVTRDTSGGIEPAFMTGHEDSVLYVSVIFVWIAAWVHQQSWQRLLAGAAVVGWLGLAVVLNNRRLAWVGLVGCCLAFYPLIGGRLKRRLKLALLCAAPLIAVYLFLARTHSEGIFSPGAELMGIANTADASTLWRVMENQNMVLTFREHRLFGSGFGHEWFEFVPLPPVSSAYKEYRLIAHNSLLWLMGVAGTIGFMFVWMPIVVGVYLAARSYHHARHSRDRTAAVAVLAIAVCYVNHAWADVGLGTPLPTFLMAVGLALAGKLATETGAWPENVKLASRPADGTDLALPSR